MHQILTYYRAFGFEFDVKKELPDYLPAMLEFLGATRAVDDLGRRTMRRDFYLRFMKPWLDKFSQCLEKVGSPYRHLAKALRQLLELDFEASP
jgi:nitrate reductase delta subunit